MPRWLVPFKIKIMVRDNPIDLNKIKNALAGVETNVKELEVFAKMDETDFAADKKNYGLAEHHLRRALEGILTIGTHILSRLPVKTKDYQEIIISLGEQGIIPKDFAENNRRLAGYRNRLVHVYWEVSAKELHEVIQRHLPDLGQFCEYFRAMLINPAKFNLRVE